MRVDEPFYKFLKGGLCLRQYIFALWKDLNAQAVPELYVNRHHVIKDGSQKNGVMHGALLYQEGQGMRVSVGQRVG